MRNFLFIILLLPLFITSQSPSIDSLAVVTYKYNNNDSIQMQNYVSLIQEHMKYSSFDSVLPISLKAIELAEKTQKDKHFAVAYNLHGVYFKIKRQYKKAIEIYSISRQYAERYEPSRILSVVYYNLSNTHNILGNGDSARLYAEMSYETALEIENATFQSLSLSALAQYYITIGDFPTALNQLNKSLKLAIDLQDTSKIISANLNIGKILFDAGKHQEMIDLYNKLLVDFDSLSISTYKDLINLNIGASYSELNMNNQSLEYTYKVLSSENEIHKGLAANNIGETYLKMIKNNVEVKDIPLIENISLENNNVDNEPIILELISNYLNNSIENFNSVNATNYKVHPLINIGEYYDYIGSPREAIKSFNNAWELADENKLLHEQKKIAEKLYEINKKQNNLKATLKWHEKYILIKDSLNSKESQQEIGKQLAQFEFTNVRLKDSLEQVKRDAIQQIKIKQQNQNIKNEKLKKYYLYGGLLITIFLLLFLFRRFNITKKQKQLIEIQKAAMEEKQIELSKTHLAIKDSINYSKKIQRAIFPSKEDMTNIFPDNFILFKPKDIVSGDFYWCYEFDNKKVIVVADCTGHGVPGAFMTIIGINILKEVIQNGIHESAEILRQINIELKIRLGQNETSVKDGMDLGICIIDDKMIEYSGAHFPLYHITENSLVEYKGSNIFLGIDDNLTDIKTHYIPYKKDDQIYMVTDGFPDQRGGVKGKKYYYKPLRELLLKNSNLKLNEQQKIMQQEFESWLKISNQKQMDDVTVIGIKF